MEDIKSNNKITGDKKWCIAGKSTHEATCVFQKS